MRRLELKTAELNLYHYGLFTENEIFLLYMQFNIF